ncbi:MAG: type III-B CRISPR module-associated protein Cmr5 [Gemmatales bacterium]|nr:type III-B CRISPR module-associated protein Cmr5 [Gemmatales bacterium]
MSTTSKSAQTLEQRRALHAWQVIQNIKKKVPMRDKQDEESSKFGVQVKKLPTRILSAGLGPALAFLKAKKYAPELLDALTDWIKIQIPPRPQEPDDLLERIVHGDSNFLRRATDEVLAYLMWLTRFAEAEGLTDAE